MAVVAGLATLVAGVLGVPLTPFVGAMKIAYLELRGTPVEIEQSKKRKPLRSRLLGRFRR